MKPPFRVGALGSGAVLTFFVPSGPYWKVSKQDGGGPLLFLMGRQPPPSASLAG